METFILLLILFAGFAVREIIRGGQRHREFLQQAVNHASQDDRQRADLGR